MKKGFTQTNLGEVHTLHSQLNAQELRKVNSLTRTRLRNAKQNADQNQKSGIHLFKSAAVASQESTRQVFEERKAKKLESERKLLDASYQNAIFQKLDFDLDGINETSEALVLDIFKKISDMRLRDGKDVLMTNVALQLVLETVVPGNLDEHCSDLEESMQLVMEAMEAVLPDSGEVSIIGNEKEFLAGLQADLRRLKMATEEEFRDKAIPRKYGEAAENVTALRDKLQKLLSKKQKKSQKRFKKTVKKLTKTLTLKGEFWDDEMQLRNKLLEEAVDAVETGPMEFLQSQQGSNSRRGIQNFELETQRRASRLKTVSIQDDAGNEGSGNVPRRTLIFENAPEPSLQVLGQMAAAGATRKQVAHGRKRAGAHLKAMAHADRAGQLDLSHAFLEISKLSGQPNSEELKKKLQKRLTRLLTGQAGDSSDSDSSDTGSPKRKQAEKDKVTHEVSRRSRSNVKHPYISDEDLDGWERNLRDWHARNPGPAEDGMTRTLLEKVAGRVQMASTGHDFAGRVQMASRCHDFNCRDCWLCKCCRESGAELKDVAAVTSASFLPPVPIPKAAPGYWLGVEPEVPSMRSTFSPALAHLQRGRPRGRAVAFGAATARPKLVALDMGSDTVISADPASKQPFRTVGPIAKSLRHRMVEVRRGRQVFSGMCPCKDLLSHLQDEPG